MNASYPVPVNQTSPVLLAAASSRGDLSGRARIIGVDAEPASLTLKEGEIRARGTRNVPDGSPRIFLYTIEMQLEVRPWPEPIHLNGLIVQDGSSANQHRVPVSKVTVTPYPATAPSVEQDPLVVVQQGVRSSMDELPPTLDAYVTSLGGSPVSITRIIAGNDALQLSHLNAIVMARSGSMTTMRDTTLPLALQPGETAHLFWNQHLERVAGDSRVYEIAPLLEVQSDTATEYLSLGTNEVLPCNFDHLCQAGD